MNENNWQPVVNLIEIHWEQGARHAAYVISAKRVEQVGNYIAQYIYNLTHANLIEMANITLVGHSLGAQCASFGMKPLDTFKKLISFFKIITYRIL